LCLFFFFSSRRRHTRCYRDWSSDVCSSDLLTGGVDVDPHLYGEKRNPLTDRPNRKRDAHELRLLRQALEHDVPVLCICRGHELLNVAMGGSLMQHIESNEHRWHENGTSNWHDVVIDGSSRLSDV